jgi:NTP pyrophosphatase (non-canonical NTP hydrolase)
MVKFDVDAMVNRMIIDMQPVMEDLSNKLFDALGTKIHETNVEKGFWEEPELMDKYAAKLSLIHSEVTEVLEALRKSQGADKVTEEFADILIRTFDLYSTLVAAGEADPLLYKVMLDKMQANKERPAKHGNRWG